MQRHTSKKHRPGGRGFPAAWLLPHNRGVQHSVSKANCVRQRCVTAILAFVAILTGLAFAPAALAQGVPTGITYEHLKSLGDAPGPGSGPRAEFIQGTDGALYGTNMGGGGWNGGTVFRLNLDGTGYTVLKTLVPATTGGNPHGRLLQGMDGALYGVTTQGGNFGGGTLFRINTDGTGFAVLYHFNSPATGGFPTSGLIQGMDGLLYGTTFNGGSFNAGTVFRMNPNGTGFTVLKHADNTTTGGGLFGGVMLASDGALYGTAAQGGTFGGGTLFRLNADGSAFTVLLHFNGTSSARFPYAGLLQGADGALYGTTQAGGSSFNGTVYKLNLDGSGFGVIQNLGGASGASPYAGLSQGFDGTLYGTTYNGVFRLNPNGTGFAVLRRFESILGWAGVIQATNGMIYGMTMTGGSADDGTLFRLNPNGTGFTVIKNLMTSKTENGNSLSSGLTQGTDGRIYSSAVGGGAFNWGTVFALNLNGTGFSVLHDFDAYSDGRDPTGLLIQASDGALYGTNNLSGETNEPGGVFKVNPNGTGFATIKTFNRPFTGGSTDSGVMQASNGMLYGTAVWGGTFDQGTLFRLNTDGTAFSVFINFNNNSTTGGFPSGPMLQAADGMLYGMARGGGSGGNGTIFKLDLDGNNITVIHQFTGSTNGALPAGGLIEGSDGALYGVTVLGGNSVGTIFKLSPDGSGFTILHRFNSALTGGSPNGRLLMGADGFLYGAASQGGTFKINKAAKNRRD